MQGQLVQLLQLLAEAHQAARLPTVFQTEDVTHFMNTDFGDADKSLLLALIMNQPVHGDHGRPSAQLGFAVDIGQDRDTQIMRRDRQF